MLLALLTGLAAGWLTTTAGMGGGQILLLVLAWYWSPHVALAVTAPALLLGNLHRLYLYRTHLERRHAAHYILGAIPGSILGGSVAVLLPEAWLQVLMVVMALVALAKAAMKSNRQLAPAWLVPGGFLVGGVSATGGGAGVLAAPMLMSAGLSGNRYLATASAGALSMHLGRLSAYGAGGLVDLNTLGTGLAVAVAITSGNLIGARFRTTLDDDRKRRLEVGVMATCVTLALMA